MTSVLTRRGSLALLAVTVIAALAIVVGTRGNAASAAVPPTEYLRAILAKHNAMEAAGGPVYQGFFTTFWDEDGDGLPNLTPDGFAGRARYTSKTPGITIPGGSRFGLGEIYSYRRTSGGSLTTAAVYGTIMISWGASGWYARYGYPLGDRRYPSAVEKAQCPGVTAIQYFRPVIGPRWAACANQAGAVTWKSF